MVLGEQLVVRRREVVNVCCLRTHPCFKQAVVAPIRRPGTQKMATVAIKVSAAVSHRNII